MCAYQFDSLIALAMALNTTLTYGYDPVIDRREFREHLLNVEFDGTTGHFSLNQVGDRNGMMSCKLYTSNGSLVDVGDVGADGAFTLYNTTTIVWPGGGDVTPSDIVNDDTVNDGDDGRVLQVYEIVGIVIMVIAVMVVMTLLIVRIASEDKRLLADLCIPENDIIVDPVPVGHGASADVHMAKLKNQVVAIKVFKPSSIPGALRPVESGSNDAQMLSDHSGTSETTITATLPYSGAENTGGAKSHSSRSSSSEHKEIVIAAKLRHPNICTVYGHTLYRGRFSIVMEYMEEGSLRRVLANATPLSSPTPSARHARISWAKRLVWLRDAAQGLDYLHNRRPAIIHRDFKTSNILIDHFGHAKITDLGAVANTREHTIEYCAPECYGRSKLRLTPAADVFSFGMVMFEVVTYTVPHEDLLHVILAMDSKLTKETIRAQHAATIRARITNGDRPPIDLHMHDAPSGYMALMQHCWHNDPAARPSMNEVLTRLNFIAADNNVNDV